MTTATTIQVSYDRQISSESGWDNPFRPGGDLSREADEIVNMIKGGKPITPTGELNNQLPTNGCSINGATVHEEATKLQITQSQSEANGVKSSNQTKTMTPKNGELKSTSPQTNVSKQIIPGPTSASHVVIENKKKSCTCCVIQ